MHQVDSMSPQERRASISLALVFAFRMLGLFMVLPVLATYGQQLQGATPLLIGMAIGAYGLTQAVLQDQVNSFAADKQLWAQSTPFQYLRNAYCEI